MSDYSPLPEALRSPKPATASTKAVQAKFLDELDFSNRQSFEDGSTWLHRDTGPDDDCT